MEGLAYLLLLMDTIVHQVMIQCLSSVKILMHAMEMTNVHWVIRGTFVVNVVVAIIDEAHVVMNVTHLLDCCCTYAVS